MLIRPMPPEQRAAAERREPRRFLQQPEPPTGFDDLSFGAVAMTEQERRELQETTDEWARDNLPQTDEEVRFEARQERERDERDPRDRY